MTALTGQDGLADILESQRSWRGKKVVIHYDQAALHTPNSGQLNVRPICPSCGEVLDGFIDSTLCGQQPLPGDPTVCIHCCAIMKFSEGLALVLPNPDEEILLRADPAVQRAIRIVMALD